MSWFEEWFDSPLYEKIYANRNREEAAQLAALIENQIPHSDFPDLLDLGCGRGRHSITLAKRGYNVTGVDLSEEAIKKARQIAAGESLNNIHFITGDMRDPLKHTFDAVLNLFTTFGYFLDDSENMDVLKNVNRLLKTGGLFMQDYLNSEQVKKNLIPSESGEHGNIHYDIERKIEDEMVFKRIRFSGLEKGKPLEFTERVKLYDLSWFEKQLDMNGMDLLTIYGNYKGGTFIENESPRLIMLSQKR